MVEPTTQSAVSEWKGMYAVGSVSAFLMALAYLIGGFISGPPNMQGEIPATVLGWFDAFRNDGLTAVFLLGFPDVVIAVASVPLFLALFAVFRSGSKTVPTLAAGLGFVGLSLYLATNASFSMLYLSTRYAQAAEADRAAILAAGQSVLSSVKSTGALFGMPLVWLACLLFSAVMLRRSLFGRLAAWAGIAGFSLLLAGVPAGGDYITVDRSGGTLSRVLTVASIGGGGAISLLWYVLVGLGFAKLERGRCQKIPGSNRQRTVST